jgi:N-acetylneuraminic acid mutarotase
VSLRSGRVLVAGGDSGVQSEGKVSRSVQVYIPAKNQWTQLPNMPAVRSGGTALLLADGSALILGGYSNDEDRWQDCDRAGGLATAIRYVPGR